MAAVVVGTAHIHIKAATGTPSCRPVVDQAYETIISGLVAKDWNVFSKPSSDPYVRILSGGEREVGRTKIVKKNLNPEWDAKFSFDVVNLTFIFTRTHC